MFKQFVESGKKARRQFIQGLIDDGKSDDALVYYCINTLLEDLRNARELVLNVDFRWLDDANLMMKFRQNPDDKNLIDPTLLNEYLEISIATGVGYPKNSEWGTFKLVPIGFAPTKLLREKFFNEYGVEAEFSRTVIEFKTGNRCFVPKRCIFNY